MTKTKAIIMTTALLLASPAIANASPLNQQKCDNPGALIRANNSKFVCSPEGGRNVWRRVNGATTIGAIVNTLPRYSLLAGALRQAGLDTALVAPGPFTLFAPRNSAFLSLPKPTLDYLLDPTNVAMLRQVLLHHVVSGSLRANDLETKSYTALDGTALKVVIRKSGITIDGSRVTMGDVIATNGVIHGVSRVIVPTSLVLP